MKIAILGGSFDPPHNGHLSVSKEVLKQLKFDKVLLIPCYKHPFNKPLSSAEHRLTMVKMIETNGIKVSSLEIDKKTISYSIDTLRTLQKTSPKDQFFWIIGSDQLESFPKWRKWQEIIRDFGLIIVPREQSIEKTENLTRHIFNKQSLPSNILSINSYQVISPVSSTIIREQVKQKKQITSLAPAAVVSYITANTLYKNQ